MTLNLYFPINLLQSAYQKVHKSDIINFTDLARGFPIALSVTDGISSQ